MPISVEERYKQIFDAHRHASDYRLKILAAWGALYAALAAVFGWVHSAAPVLGSAIAFVGVCLTALFWIGDRRNRVAIHRSKSVGGAIESDPSNEIPKNQHFFGGLNRGISHSLAIDVFGGLMSALLLSATYYLFRSGGVLPK